MNSIRISDHKGKQHLSYRYNVEVGVRVAKWYKDDKGFWRYNCPSSKKEIDKLIEIVLSSKMEKKIRYKGRYEEIMERYKQRAITEKGFWKQAKQVKSCVNECDATPVDIDYYD